MERRSAFGWVVFLGCVLIGCKMFKKDEPVVDAAAEPPPAAEAAAPEVDAAATTTPEASTPEDPTPANTTNVPVVKKDGGVKDAGTVADAGTTAPADAGTAKPDAGAPKIDAGNPAIQQCKFLCGATYTSCMITKKKDATKCASDRDACNAKCK
jgi:hypothetical protein